MSFSWPWLLIDEQSEALQELNQVVHRTEAMREAESPSRLAAPGNSLFFHLLDPFLRAYKDDPRFIAFAQKVGVMPKAAAKQ
jgi:hypothetical protein